MLVIRRHAGEAIQIGEEVEVVVIDCGPGRVKLGIRAPKHIAVLRAELKITREQNLAAARVANASDGIGQLQIIDGGLTNISHILDRLKTLATQSASTTFTGSRTTLNNEFQALLLEINRQAANVGLSNAAGGDTYLTKMNVYIGGGNAANSVNSNAQVSVDLSTSAVDATGLGISSASVLGGGVGFALNTAKSLNDPGSRFATAQNFSINFIDSNGVAQNRTVTYANSATETGAKVVSDLNAALATQGVSGITTQIGSDGQLLFVGSGCFTVSTTAAAGAAVTNGGNAGTMSLVNTAKHYLQSGAFAAYADNAGTAAVDVLTFTDASNTTTQVTLHKVTANTLANAVITLNGQFKSQGMAISALDDGARHISFQSVGDFRISYANTAAVAPGTGAIFGAAGDQGNTLINAQSSATGAALAAIDAISRAITVLGLVQGHIGASKNMLSYASSLAQSQITTFNSTEAQIRDTDIAAAANLTKAQVLQQVSLAAMAQANSAPQQGSYLSQRFQQMQINARNPG